MIFFLHIPKTAGTSFYELVKNNHHVFLKPKLEDLSSFERLATEVSNCAIRLPGGYESAPTLLNTIETLSQAQLEKIDFIGGHVGYGFHEKIKGRMQYISFLRDPKERLVSDFKEHCKEGRHFYAELKSKGFQFNHYLELLKQHRLDNLLTRQLLGPTDFFLKDREQLTSENFAQALDHSKNVVFFKMEHFDRSLAYLARNHAWYKMTYQKKNVSINSQENLVYDPSLLAEIIAFDIKLYNTITPEIPEHLSISEKIKFKLKDASH